MSQFPADWRAGSARGGDAAGGFDFHHFDRSTIVALVGEQNVGPYRLLSALMTGRTSQVWEAIDDRDRKHYALKFLLWEHRKDREHVAFLKHEFAVASQLEHPRIIQVYSHGTFSGGPYMVMQLFPAPNLKFYVTRNIELLACLVPYIIEQASDALAYFNHEGWIHRDIKPDNFLLSREGEVKLIDFALAVKKATGLARLFGGKLKKVQGTRSYMSPEQIRGQPLDERADVYSFGCMLHEMVAGKPPFTGVSSNELLMKHLRTPAAPLGSYNRNVTDEFSQLILRTLTKKRDRRLESIEQFRREFRSIEVFKVPPQPPQE